MFIRPVWPVPYESFMQNICFYLLNEKVVREGIKTHSVILDGVYCFLSIQTCNPFIKRNEFALRGFAVDKSILSLTHFLVFFHVLQRFCAFQGFSGI